MKKKTPRNDFEKDVQRQIRRAKIVFKYEAEHIPYVIARHYIPDFILWTPLGKVYVECKGYLRPEDKRKLVAVKRTNPRLDLRLLFYEERPAQIKWAIRQGFRYAVKTIPEEWMKGL